MSYPTTECDYDLTNVKTAEAVSEIIDHSYSQYDCCYEGGNKDLIKDEEVMYPLANNARDLTIDTTELDLLTDQMAKLKHVISKIND
jgi:hypothetical protein